MKIALVDPSLFTIPYDRKLAEALHGIGHEVIIYGDALAQPENQFGQLELRRPFYLELGPFRGSSWPKLGLSVAKGAVHWRGMRRLVVDLVAQSPDIIHFQWLPLPAVDRLFLSKLRYVAPLVLTAHDSTPFNGSAAWLQRISAGRVVTDFDHVIVHTHEARARLMSRGVPASRVSTIPHGLLHDEQPVPAATAGAGAAIRFLLFGKLKPYKGADLLIEAFRHLPTGLRARAEVQIVGKPYMDVRPLLKAAEGEDQIHFDFRLVSDAEMSALLAGADVIVFPYREIDISGVLMAALRHARPIIASRIGGFAELLVDGRHGILVPPGDVAALASAMAELCTDPERRRSMSQAIRNLYNAIPSWNEIAGETERLYRRLLDAPTGAASLLSADPSCIARISARS